MLARMMLPIIGAALLAAPAAAPAQVWLPVGSGMNGEVNALTVYDGGLIAGGAFTSAGGVSASRIARWDGSAWSALGAGIDGPVLALAEYDGDLIAAGDFTMAGAASASNIARWDGAMWSPLGAGVSHTVTNSSVIALTVYGGRLVACGVFDTAGGGAAHSIAAWDGSSWAPLGAGFPGEPVSSLAVYEGDLVAGVSDFVADESLVMRWDGAAWAQMGAPIGDGRPIQAMIEHEGQLVASGPDLNVWLWDGAAWLYMSPGGPGGGAAMIRGVVSAFVAHDNGGFAGNELFIAGSVDELRVPSGPGTTRIVSVNNIVAWSGGDSFRRYDDGVGVAVAGDQVRALTVYNGDIIAGGQFEAAGGSSAANIARLGRPDAPACYADCDGSGGLDFFDFLCFQDAFGAGCP